MESTHFGSEKRSSLSIPELFGNKRIYTLQSVYGSHSEIPRQSSELSLQSLTRRRLFQQTTCACDCDCSSGGCKGCIRRNRRVLMTTVSMFVGILVVLMVVSALTYNFTRKFREKPKHDPNHLTFHYHLSNSSPESHPFDEYGSQEERMQEEVPRKQYVPQIPLIVLKNSEDDPYTKKYLYRLASANRMKRIRRDTSRLDAMNSQQNRIPKYMHKFLQSSKSQIDSKVRCKKNSDCSETVDNIQNKFDKIMSEFREISKYFRNYNNTLKESKSFKESENWIGESEEQEKTANAVQEKVEAVSEMLETTTSQLKFESGHDSEEDSHDDEEEESISADPNNSTNLKENEVHEDGDNSGESATTAKQTKVSVFKFGPKNNLNNTKDLVNSEEVDTTKSQNISGSDERTITEVENSEEPESTTKPSISVIPFKFGPKPAIKKTQETLEDDLNTIDQATNKISDENVENETTTDLYSGSSSTTRDSEEIKVISTVKTGNETNISAPKSKESTDDRNLFSFFNEEEDAMAAINVESSTSSVSDQSRELEGGDDVAIAPTDSTVASNNDLGNKITSSEENISENRQNSGDASPADMKVESITQKIGDSVKVPYDGFVTVVPPEEDFNSAEYDDDAGSTTVDPELEKKLEWFEKELEDGLNRTSSNEDPETTSELPTTTTNNEPVSPTPQAEEISLMSLREVKNLYQKNNEDSESPRVITNNDVHFPTGSGNEPTPVITAGQSLKTNQQLSVAAFQHHFPPYQVCFYGTPKQMYKKRSLQPKSLQNTKGKRSPQGVYDSQPPPQVSYGGGNQQGMYGAQQPPQLPYNPQGMYGGQQPPQAQNYYNFIINNYHDSPPSISAAPYDSAPHQVMQQFSSVPQHPPLFCTYLMPPVYQFPTVSGTSEGSSDPRCLNCDPATIEEPLPEKPQEKSEKGIFCPASTFECQDTSECIPENQRCDGLVHCGDASDEKDCACTRRVDRERVCDGYFDCPDGEDELGCFDCPKDSFSCDDWDRQGIKDTCVTMAKRCDGTSDCPNGKDELDCAVLTQKLGGNDTFLVSYLKGYLQKNWKGVWYPVCGGGDVWAAEACLGVIGQDTGKPEVNLMPEPNNHRGLSLVRTDDGNYEARATCPENSSTFVECPFLPCGTRVVANTNPENNDVFDFENRFKRLIGPHNSSVVTNSSETDLKNYKGLKEKLKAAILKTVEHNKTVIQMWKDDDERYKRYLQDVGEINRLLEEIEQTNDDKAFMAIWNHLESDIAHDFDVNDVFGTILPLDDVYRMSRQEAARVVGGKASEPGSWPWVVALFKNGYFHCGGVILDENWVLTAAHCVDHFEQHYYEVQAGMLRRLSFSPMEQTRTVSNIVVHQLYEKLKMKNDLALLQLETPLQFNKWVRGVCLPNLAMGLTAGLWGPQPGTLCTAVGWGAIQEHGPDPDHMREVQVPILPRCKHLADLEGAEICAGLREGGRDTCQGDSGGPLLCRDPKNNEKWYVAGIVSHGEGCARPDEPGAYTRISLYLDWIQSNTEFTSVPLNKPKTKCPGIKCTSIPGRCLPIKYKCDGRVDCLGAEDELNCPETKLRSESNEDNDNATTNSESTTWWGTNETETETESTTSYHSEEIQAKKFNGETQSNRIMDFEGPVKGTVLEPKKFGFSYNETMGELLGEFRCALLKQLIPGNRKCDGVLDCEDGSDEINCTCRDYLLNSSPELICDGIIDCQDKTDERNCYQCPSAFYNCRISKKCILRTERCDNKRDCRLGEDEEECTILSSDGVVDEDGVGLETEGILLKMQNGYWTVYDTLNENHGLTKASQVCTDLATKGYELFQYLEMEEDVIMSNEISTEGRNHSRLYVQCSKQLAFDTLKMTRLVKSGFVWPWNVLVYMDGSVSCSGVWLQDEWVLTPMACVQGVELSKNYVLVKFGSRRPELHISEAYITRRTVDEIRPIPDLNVVLLHINESVTPNKLQRPITLSPVVTDKVGQCVAVGLDGINKYKTVYMQRTMGCGDKLCLKKLNHTSNCEPKPWAGIVVCQADTIWTPFGVYDDNNGVCGLNDNSYQRIDDKLNLLQETMDKPLYLTGTPRCFGHRSQDGLCIAHTVFCDVKPGAPALLERAALCNDKQNQQDGIFTPECRPSEFRCDGSKCISKALFNNGVLDCVDGSDEPENVTCATYLRATAPHLLCDGKRNCLDKTDEILNQCQCTRESFQCSSSSKCFSKDFICDGEKDCLGGEDEEKCIGVPKHNLLAASQVMVQSFGVWHQKCVEPEEKIDIQPICKQMNCEKCSTSYEDTKSIVPRLDPFQQTTLNANTTITLRGQRPLVLFTSEPQPCRALFITCIE